MNKRLKERIAARAKSTDAMPPKYSVITVRMPKELHERIRDLAHDYRTSMNIFCVSALECASDEPQ